MAPSPLDRVHHEVSRCNRCGFCQSACPVYQVTRRESSTARGHSYQVRSVLEGHLEASADLSQPLHECLLCRACLPQCSQRVQTDEVVVAGRQALAGRKRWPDLLPLVFRKLLLNPRRLGRYAALLAVIKRTGLARMASLPGGSLARAAGLLPEVPRQPLCQRTRGLQLAPASPKGKVVYFVGCGANYLLPEVGEAAIRVLVASGYEVEVAGNYCCGLPPYAYGDLPTARRLAKGNLRLLNCQGVDAVVTECASCSSFLKGYPRLLQDEPAFSQSASLLADRVLDITQLLARSTLDPQLPTLAHSSPDTRLSTLPLTVTYHDPCHASRYQGLQEEPRRVLKSIPGVTLVEMEEADWCCGGAGTYTLANPALAQRILDRKIDNVERTGAEALVTSCPSCILHLSYGVRRRGLPVKVLHLAQVVENSSRVLPG